jgi:hypothetical protein
MASKLRSSGAAPGARDATEANGSSASALKGPTMKAQGNALGSETGRRMQSPERAR